VNNDQQEGSQANWKVLPQDYHAAIQEKHD
jgi:hypothetical protein